MIASIPIMMSVPILLVAAYCDLRWMRIPNILSLLILGIFVITLPLLPPSEAGLRLAAGAFVFAIGFVLFAFGLFGGGDVKLISALICVVPTESWTLMAYVFSGSMVVGMILVHLWQSSWFARSTGWTSAIAKNGFPMGTSIALAGTLQMFATL